MTFVRSSWWPVVATRVPGAGSPCLQVGTPSRVGSTMRRRRRAVAAVCGLRVPESASFRPTPDRRQRHADRSGPRADGRSPGRVFGSEGALGFRPFPRSARRAGRAARARARRRSATDSRNATSCRISTIFDCESMTSQFGFPPPVMSSLRAVCWSGSLGEPRVALRLQQVERVPERRADHAARSEDAVDVARLPWRFDDYEVSHERR